MRSLDGHAKDVRNVAFLPDGRLVSVGADKTARLWDVRAGTGALIHKARGPLYAVAPSPDGRTVAIAGRHGTPDNPIALYDVATGKIVTTLRWSVWDEVHRHEGDALRRTMGPVPRAIWSLSFSNDSRSLAAAGRRPGGGNIPNGGGGDWWTVSTGKLGDPLPDDAYAVQFAPAGLILAVTVRRGVRFYATAENLNEHVELPIPADWAPAVAFLGRGETAVAAAGAHLYFRSFTVPEEKARKPLKVKTGMRAVTALAPTPDGRALLAAGKPGRVEIYDTTAAVPVLRTAYDFEVGGVHGLAVAPDGLTFAVAGEKGLLVCDLDG